MSNEQDTTDNTIDTGGATTTMEPDSSTAETPAASPPPPNGPGAYGPSGYGPGPQMRPSPNGLTRDPYSALGGVASGIAHRYGLSTALIRLVFVVVTFATFFFALPIYLAAWAIIPRATVWPPEALRLPGQKFSSRDLGVIALVGGLIAFLLFGVDGVGSVLVALTFVTAGVALLLQHERHPAPPAPDAAATGYAFTPQPNAPVGQPVAPRSAGRKWFLGLAIGSVILFFSAIVAVPIAFIAWGDLESFDIETGTIDFRFDDDVAFIDVAPTDVADLPEPIDAEGGDISIDLSDIDLAEFEALIVPAEIDIELGAGDIEIILPEGLGYSIDAEVNDGRISGEVDGESLPIDSSSTGKTLTVDDDDADLVLHIELRRGDLTVETAS